MSKIVDWFETPPTQAETWRLIRWTYALASIIIASFFIYCLASGDLSHIVNELNDAMREAVQSNSALRDGDFSVVNEIVMPLIGWIFLVGVFAPFVEEFVFRLAPLGLAILLFRWSLWTKPLIFLVAVIAGFVFGLVHISNERTTLASVLLIQGIIGVCWGFLFAKVSGLKLRGLGRAYWTTVKAHCFWNILIVPLIYVIFLLIVGPVVIAKVHIPPELLP